jgi:hypothetical protein
MCIPRTLSFPERQLSVAVFVLLSDCDVLPKAASRSRSSNGLLLEVEWTVRNDQAKRRRSRPVWAPCYALIPRIFLNSSSSFSFSSLISIS